MDTTAAMPKIMDAMNNSNRFMLALPSRHAIVNNHEMGVLDLFVILFTM
jgi:hypothetical protein